jgi:hypothetical protein
VVLLVGADKAAQLVDPGYYDDPEAALARLARAASVLVAERSGHSPPALPLAAGRLATADWVPSRSATQARAAAAARRDLRGLVPAPVAAAIERTGVYDLDPAGYRRRAAALTELVENVNDPRAARGGQDGARGLLAS